MKNKKTRYAVMKLDTRNGWTLFAATPDGRTLVHDHTRMVTFTEKEADAVVAYLKESIKIFTPGLLDCFCVSKVRLA